MANISIQNKGIANMMKYKDFYRIFVMGHSFTPYQNINNFTTKRDRFCKLYLEAQTGYHPKEQKYSWYFDS